MQRTDEELRELAMKRIKEKDGFKIHLAIYVAINTMFVGIWWFTSGGFFWPIFPIVGWGIGVVINGYVAYRGEIYSEEAIQREIRSIPR